MACSECGGEYCDGEKCSENGGENPYADPVEDDNEEADEADEADEDPG